MNDMDLRDWFILVHVNAALAAATVFLFLNANSVNFATWAGLVATVVSAYHWMCSRNPS